MDTERALYAVGLLVSGVPSEDWTDDVVDRYVHEFSTQFRDADCLIRACEDVSRNWQWKSVPRLRDVHDAYKAAVMRRELSQPMGELPSGEKPCDWRKGLEIAREEYRKERERQGLGVDEDAVVRWLDINFHRRGSGLRRLGNY